MRRLVAVAGILLAAACSNGAPAQTDTDGRPAAPAQQPSASSAESSPDAPLAVAFGLPRVVAVGVLASRSMVTEAVFFATSQRGGALTTTGTVAQTQAGWQYSASPADRLVVRSGNDVQEFSAIQASGGGGAPTAAQWLEAEHRLSYHHRSGDLAEATIDESFDGRTFQTHMTGWATVQGQRYDIDLWSRGQTGGNILADSRDTTTTYTLTGSIKGNGTDIDVQEQHESHYVSMYSVGFLPSQRGYATDLRATMATSMKWNGATFTFTGVQIQAFDKEKGGQQSSGLSAVNGQILRNGSPFATCTLQGSRALASAGGTVIPLDVAMK